ncbi:MAG: PASTA domain-containing protein, partial [Deltaproteobacteria bacterium]
PSTPPATAAASATRAPADDADTDEEETAEMVTVPHLARLDEDEARRRLEAVGLRGRFDSRFSPSVPTGLVILSRPGAGEAVPRGGRVMVFVAE